MMKLSYRPPWLVDINIFEYGYFHHSLVHYVSHVENWHSIHVFNTIMFYVFTNLMILANETWQNFMNILISNRKLFKLKWKVTLEKILPYATNRFAIVSKELSFITRSVTHATTKLAPYNFCSKWLCVQLTCN
jgi:hypothetical protein